jgi:hypothetical protein
MIASTIDGADKTGVVTVDGLSIELLLAGSVIGVAGID